MASKNVQGKLTLHFPDEGTLMQVRAIMSYEAAIRGLSVSQLCTEMVLEAVDIDEYPDEVQQRIRDILEEGRQQAAQKALSQDD